MARREDWRARFRRFVAQRRDLITEWGQSDCFLTACDWVEAATYEDISNGVRGRYATRFGAARRMRELGFASIAEYLNTKLPMAERARAGDIVAFPDGPLNTLMIADARGNAWGWDKNGLRRVAIPAGALAWSV